MNSNTQYQYQFTSTGISPTYSGTGGGNTVNITGTGFSKNTLVTIDSNECKVVYQNPTLITCIVPANVIIL